MLAKLWAHRELVVAMVARELSGRFRGSFAGVLWAVAQPLILLALYTFVFKAVLQVKFGPDGSTSSFALTLFAGMIPWLAFSEALTRSPMAVLAQPNLVKKVVFPLEILPLNVVLAALVNSLAAFAVLGAALWMSGHPMSGTLFLLPLLLLLQFLFTQGLAWFLASAGVFVRDVGAAMGLVSTAWLFLTPVMYPASAVPERYQAVMALNPMASLVEAYRAVLLEGRWPDVAALGGVAVVGAMSFAAGYLFFAKTRPSFADVL